MLLYYLKKNTTELYIGMYFVCKQAQLAEMSTLTSPISWNKTKSKSTMSIFNPLLKKIRFQIVSFCWLYTNACKI